jgi:threonine dehydratase
MLPSFDDVEKAARRLQGYAARTPVIESPALNQRAGGRVLIKAECLQRTGSFKFRGAWNRISQLDKASAPGGVVAYSSGNHAQGVAAAAQIRGLPALIVMPADTPLIKQQNTKSYCAEVVTYDRATESREAIAAGFVKERGAVLVPPFDDPTIIAGQGTCGLEIVEDYLPTLDLEGRKFFITELLDYVCRHCGELLAKYGACSHCGAFRE